MIKSLAYNDYLRSLVVTDALPFIDMVALEQSTKIILTDSSGVQQEASFFGLRALGFGARLRGWKTASQRCNCLTRPQSKDLKSI